MDINYEKLEKEKRVKDKILGCGLFIIVILSCLSILFVKSPTEAFLYVIGSIAIVIIIMTSYLENLNLNHDQKVWGRVTRRIRKEGIDSVKKRSSLFFR